MSTVAILGISLLIVLHELGHFLTARLFDMRVLRFSIGFGPALLKKTFGETTWQIAAIPLGGFVQVDGMGPRDTDVFEDDERNYRNKPAWQRAIVIAAGPVTNWVLAAFFIGVLAVTVGYTKADESQAAVGELAPDGRGADAGLMAGDRILSIDGERLHSWNDLLVKVRASPEKLLQLEVQRGEVRFLLPATPAKSPDGEHGVLGIAPMMVRERVSPVGALGYGISETWRLTVHQLQLFWGVIAGTQAGRLGGLPAIIQQVTAEAKRGAERLLRTLAWLSITLCVFNVLPIPALDGGRLGFLLAEVLRGKPVDEQVESRVHAVGFVLLLGLMLFVSVRDLL